MQYRKRLGLIIYVFWDWFSAVLSWTLLFGFRKFYVEGNPFDSQLVFSDPSYFMGISFIPLGWLLLYYITGTYTDIYRKSRMKELFKTFLLTLIGVIFLFFTVLLDDLVFYDTTNYYRSIVVLFISHFLLTFTGRFTILNTAKRQLKTGKVGYKTLMIGGNKSAEKLYDFFENESKSFGYNFIGFVQSNQSKTHLLEGKLKKLGTLDDLDSIMDQYKVDDVIVAIDSMDHDKINLILSKLYPRNVVIKVAPGLYDILAGSVRMNNVLDAPLIELFPDMMPFQERIIKRFLDLAVSFFALFLLSPVMFYAAFRVRMSSKGPIFYSQERIGLNGKPFRIYKFRSMYQNAEQKGPALSSDNDTRITSWGKTMRKWRIDETPQFWNVLKGEMSLVGPRPERKYFIDQIVERAPAYRYLQKVKPGITSLGMVKFGYAENVDQMIERMEFDLLYIENMSLAIDFKILAYTVITIIKGKGK